MLNTNDSRVPMEVFRSFICSFLIALIFFSGNIIRHWSNYCNTVVNHYFPLSVFYFSLSLFVILSEVEVHYSLFVILSEVEGHYSLFTIISPSQTLLPVAYNSGSLLLYLQYRFRLHR